MAPENTGIFAANRPQTRPSAPIRDNPQLKPILAVTQANCPLGANSAVSVLGSVPAAPFVSPESSTALTKLAIRSVARNTRKLKEQKKPPLSVVPVRSRFSGSTWKPVDTARRFCQLVFIRRSSMARPLIFQLGDDQVSLQMNKVDRTRLYGSKEQLVLDESEAPCELATLADDGQTLIGKGGTTIGWIDADGNWCDKSQLNPINADGEQVEPVASSFGTPIPLLKEVSVEDYLEHNIRLVYSMQLDEEEDEANPGFSKLTASLKEGSIFHFDYSFRGGLQADAAFLLANDEGEVMMAVGTRTKIEMVGLQSQADSVSSEEDEVVEEDSFDFGMI